MIFENDNEKKTQLLKDIAKVFNIHGVDNELNTPDHILADYVYTALENLRITTVRTDAHFGLRKLNGEIICAQKIFASKKPTN